MKILFQTLGKYITMNSTPGERRLMEVGELMPWRRYRKGPQPTITGKGALRNSTEPEAQWIFQSKQFSDREEARLMGVMIKLGTKALYDHHT